MIVFGKTDQRLGQVDESLLGHAYHMDIETQLLRARHQILHIAAASGDTDIGEQPRFVIRLAGRLQRLGDGRDAAERIKPAGFRDAEG